MSEKCVARRGTALRPTSAIRLWPSDFGVAPVPRYLLNAASRVQRNALHKKLLFGKRHD